MRTHAGMNIKEHIQAVWHNYTKVVENYVFMTILQILNMCFYLLIYPFLIRTLGADGYGVYAFAWSVVAICSTIVSFGFDLPSAGRVAKAAADKEQLSRILSSVQSAKLLLELGVLVIYALGVLFVPLMQEHRLIFAIAFLDTLTNIFFPQWYFQGVQRMRVVTYIQLGLKLVSLPVIFLFIHSPEDTWIFMLITVLTNLTGAAIAWSIIRWQDGIRQRLTLDVRPAYQEALPFFLSNAMGIIKERGIVILIGSFLNMTDVAIYDLANKIIWVPRAIMMKFNDALYPKIIVEKNAATIRRILYAESAIGLVVIALMAIFGPWVIRLIGGPEMTAAYTPSLILSITVLCWLLATGYINFVFIPSGYRYLVTCNQATALLSCALVATLAAALYPTVNTFTWAIALSGICEVIFCLIISKKKQLL